MMRVLCLAILLVSQDKTKIEIAVESNVTYAVEATYKGSGKIKIEQGGQTEERSDLFENEEAAWTETILDVKDGSPFKMEMEFSKSKFERKDLDDQEKVSGVRSTQGKKLTLLEVGGKRTKIEAPEGVDKKDLRDIRIRNDALRKSIPTEAIPVGHKWQAEERMLLRDSNDQDGGIEYVSGSATYTFLRIEERRKEKCAVVEAKTELVGKGQGAMKMTVKAETIFYISLEKKHVIESNGKGTYEFKGGGDDVGYVFTGSGSFETLTKVTRK
jgi:hypothetical protein